MENYNGVSSNLESNSNTDYVVCQEGDLEDCNCCEGKQECKFWDCELEECNYDEFEFTWAEMSYRKFIQRSVNFKHSELQ